MARDTLAYAIGNSASTTLSVAAANSDTSMTITSDTNFAAKSGEGMVIIDESQATEELAYSASKTGATLSTPLVNRGLEGGSAQAHAINATVKGVLTAAMWNDMVDALTNVLLKTTGAVDTTKVVTLTGTQTLTNKTLTSPVLTTPQINDTSSDHQYVFAGSELTADRTVTLPLLTGADVFVFADFVQTLTNKRITPRVVTQTNSSATPTINTDITDIFSITGQTADITSFTTNLSGTPTSGQKLIIQITGTAARALTWGTGFEASTVALPTTTVTTAMLSVGFIYNSATNKFTCVASV